MQTFQSSYTKAINKKYTRHGSLFEQHYNAKHIEEENYFITLAFYIHQNPVRSKLVDRAEEWEFSSCQDYIELRKGSLPNKELILERFTIDEIRDITRVNKVSSVGKVSDTFQVSGT